MSNGYYQRGGTDKSKTKGEATRIRARASWGHQATRGTLVWSTVEVCAVAAHAEGELDKRLCTACHRPPQVSTLSSVDHVSQVTQCVVEDINKGGWCIEGL